MKLQSLRLCRIEIEIAGIGLDDLESRIQQLGKVSGWLRRRSGLTRFEVGEELGWSKDLGEPIQGEWYGPDPAVSWSLDLTEPKKWLLRTLSEHSEDGKRGIEAQAETITLTGNAFAGAEQRYAIYWAEREPGAIRRLAARLIAPVNT